MPTSIAPKKRLGEVLLDKSLLTPEQLDNALHLQKQTGKRVGQIIIESGTISEKDMLAVLSEQFALPSIWLRPGLFDPEVVRLIDKGALRRMEILPLFKVRQTLTVASADPQALPQFDEIERRTGCKVRVVLAIKSEILKCIEEAFSGFESMTEYIGDLEEDFEVVESNLPDDYIAIDEMAEKSPVVNLVNSMIQRAVSDGASDIHIEPSQNKCRIRYRIDSVLYEVMSPKITMHSAIVSRLKVMASLDIAERRLPMDGRIQVRTQGRTVDLRFSSLPGICGEKIVLRILDKDKSILDIDNLGMTQSNRDLFLTLLGRTNGLILVTGPTGSGKSTTLYAAINHLNTLEKNIVTIEDPVEYQLDIINQNQVKESIGLGFASMLKHVLRQDPDIIMVGEIRERETASIAVQAALTGHLVLSTLHTNDSVGAITRLLDMGIEPFLLSSALIGVIGQRLVRTICPECKTSFLAGKEVAELLGANGEETLRLSKARGCPTCYDSGFKGRLAIHELLTVDSELQRLMIANPTRDELEEYLQQLGVQTLINDGYDRVIRGLTTLEEVSRVAQGA